MIQRPLSEQLGLCIRAHRRALGLSQVEFAERCGFYQTYLSRVERGQANPTINAIEVVANALGMGFFELIARVERMAQDDAEDAAGPQAE